MRLIYILLVMIVVGLGICSAMVFLIWQDITDQSLEWQKARIRIRESSFLARINSLLGRTPKIYPTEKEISYSEPEEKETQHPPEEKEKPTETDSGFENPSTPPPTYPYPVLESNKDKKEQQTISYHYSPPQTKKEETVVLVDTKIISGPQQNEIITETNQVEFQFEANITPKDSEGRIWFETKIEGFEEDWRTSYSNQRKVRLPAGPKEYEFQVRAKIGLRIDRKYETFIDTTPAKRKFKINTSPYFNKIRISQMKSKTSSEPCLITLSSRLRGEEEINITGWKIEGENRSFVIPKGIERYDPHRREHLEDIFVKSGDRIYLSGGENPKGRDNNFKLNRCMGYLTNFYDFPIRIPRYCPSPRWGEEDFTEEILDLSDYCQQYILDIRRCEIPDYEENSQIVTDPDCVDYITENFNYSGCFKNYSNEEDFLQSQWHIYMGKNIVGEGIDIFYLKDKNGLVVDKYLYKDLY